MAQLKGGTTIGGYLAIHLGNLKNSIEIISNNPINIKDKLIIGNIGNASAQPNLNTLDGGINKLEFRDTSSTKMSITFHREGISTACLTSESDRSYTRWIFKTDTPKQELTLLNAQLLVYSNFVGQDDWLYSPISIRERNLIGTSSSEIKYAPNLNFHWSGRVSRSLYMGPEGTLYYGEYDSSGNPVGDKIWHAGNDGHNSGLDADLLDGYHASDFALANHTHVNNGSSSIIKRQYFTASNGQTVFSITNGTMTTGNNSISVYLNGLKLPNNAYTETNSTTITLKSGCETNDQVVIEWFENIGQVSVTDADTLDGYHASSFSLSSHNHDSTYAAKSNPSVTGSLTITASGNAGIELGRTDGTASTPYIDFHSGATSCDYDTRIIASGGNGTSGKGDLEIIANSLKINGGASFNTTTTNPTSTSRINCEGYFYATRVYNAVYNDYAEYFEKDENLEPGDIVIKNPHGEGYVKSRYEFDDLVVGVVSDEYATCIGGEGKEDDEKKYSPVGLAGRINVKIKGKCKIGDLVVASDIPGVGMAIDKKQYIPGTVIGKVLENKYTDEIKRVRMLIMNC